MTALEIVELQPILLVGIRKTTNLAARAIPAMWRSFRPQVGKIVTSSPGFYNVSIYPAALNIRDFGPMTNFEAWVAVAAPRDQGIPEGMEVLSVEGGTYAKIEYRGLAQNFGPFAARLYGQLIPEAGYTIDNQRPHFEYLSEHYRPDDPEAREEVYVPVIKAS